MMNYFELFDRMEGIHREMVELGRIPGCVGITEDGVQVNSNMFNALFPEGPDKMEYYQGTIHVTGCKNGVKVVAVFK